MVLKCYGLCFTILAHCRKCELNFHWLQKRQDIAGFTLLHLMFSMQHAPHDQKTIIVMDLLKYYKRSNTSKMLPSNMECCDSQQVLQYPLTSDGLLRGANAWQSFVFSSLSLINQLSLVYYRHKQTYSRLSMASFHNKALLIQ